MRKQAVKMGRRALAGTAAVLLGASLALSPLSLPQAVATPATSKQAEAQEALNSLNSMKAKVAEAESNYGAAMVEQDEAQKRMDDAQDRIDEASEQISDLQGQLSVRAKNMYMNGATSFLDILFGSATFQAFTTNWDMLNTMNQNDADMVQQTKDLRAEVEEQKAEYTEQKKVADQKAEEMESILAEAEALVAEQQAVYDSLSAEAAALVKQEEEAAAAAAAAASQNNNDNNGGGGNQGSTSSAKEPAYVASSGNAIVDRARSWVGRASYVWGGCSPGAFDCSGFVSYCLTGVYSRLGTTTTFMSWPRVSDPQPGDVCVNYGHCGIYVGNGRMIHAATYGVGVIEGSVQSGMIYVRR